MTLWVPPKCENLLFFIKIISLTSLRRDCSCSKFKIATEAPSGISVWTPQKHSTKKGGFPCATTRGMAEEVRFYTIRTYHHVSCLGCKILAFFFTVRSDQLLLPCSSPILHFAAGSRGKESMVHKASLDVLVSFLPGSSCKNQFHAAFQFPKFTLFNQVNWKRGFKIPHCQRVIFSYQFLPNKFQIPCSFSAKSDRMVGAEWVKIGTRSQCGKGCSTYPYHTSEDTNRRLAEMRGAREGVL